jgi:hypothetical protein
MIRECNRTDNSPIRSLAFRRGIPMATAGSRFYRLLGAFPPRMGQDQIGAFQLAPREHPAYGPRRFTKAPQSP